MISRVGKALRIISDDEKDKIALVIDTPSLMPDFKLTDLELLKKHLGDLGTIRAGKLISDKQFTQNESDLINSQGFREEIVGSDVDIHVSLNALEYLGNDSISIIGIGTSNYDLFPVFSRIKQDKKLLIISWKDDITSSMESIADYILYLDYLD
ncbi:MAG: hypothetical protein FK733_11820 [Asgard group archaeon]|nr:hypothetical protein [Asgard group archaeon]